ncbi:MAG: HAD hydrolase-like protein [Acidobacteria bacterium]|nr:HAD hydrolase-like protein [Acidobacteriota bacterium]
MNILALDFDGVIADTSRETFIVSLRTWARVQPRSELAHHPLAGGNGAAAAGYPFDSDPIYVLFVETMALGNRAEDFGVVLAAHHRGVRFADQESYNSFRDRFPAAWLERFHHAYYQERDAFRQGDPRGWQALQRPYPHMVRLLRRREAQGSTAVVTARDRASLLQLLAAWGLDRVIPTQLVYDKETGLRKTAHLRRLLEDTGASPEEVTFVDDKVSHLMAAAPLGVRGVLAGWGHNTRREREEARRLGLPVATVKNASRLLL